MIANKTSFFFKDFYKTKVVTYTIDINKNVHSEFLKHVEGWVIFGHGSQRPEIIGKSADAEFLAAASQTKLFYCFRNVGSQSMIKRFNFRLCITTTFCICHEMQ